MYKLSELAKTVTDQLKEMGSDDPYIHKTRLKEQLLSKIDGLRPETVGRDVVLLFNDDIKSIVSEYFSRQNECYQDDLILRKAAQILRKEIFNDNKFSFTGSLINEFTSDNAFPEILIHFLDMVLFVSNEHIEENTISTNLPQVIKFNARIYTQIGTF